MIWVLEMKKVSHNMILMSKYKGKHGGKKGQKIRAGVSPPPLFGQCPKENIFFFRRASLTFYLLSLSYFISPPKKAAVRQNAVEHTPVMRPLFLMFDNDTQSYSQVLKSYISYWSLSNDSILEKD